MLGAIVGDYVGSIYEFHGIKTTHFPFPMGGYGSHFADWLFSRHPQPYGSFGNGAAMRVSAAAWAFDTLEEVEKCADAVTGVTHNHPEGIKGARATAAAILMARQGKSQPEIRDFIEKRYGYNLSRTIDEIRPTYRFDGSCQGSVPEAIIAFLDAKDFENAVRLSVSLGGDADTQAAITGSIAEGMWGIPDKIANHVYEKLDPFLKDTLTRWENWRGK